jgi:L-amino acid N-acyltransferase YncA
MADFQIRKMKPEERKQVLAIMRQAFPVFMQLFLSLSKDTLVAEADGKILGGIVIKIFKLSKGQKGGVVEWIFTGPDARGLGAGQALAEAGLAWLEKAGCSQVFAIVEGFNTSSSKLFATRGFSILPFREQIRRFGLFGLFRVWYASFHMLDVGHFLWGKPETVLPDRPAPQFLWTIILNCLVAALVVWRAWDFGMPDLTALWALPLSTLILIELRAMAMTLAAKRQGLALRFRMWESGYNLSFALALIFGFFFPVPGSFYPDKPVWRYRDHLSGYGKVGLAGALPTIILAWALFFLRLITPMPAWAGTLLSFSYTGAIFFAIFDILLIFFPYVSFNGRRIWDWNKFVWTMCAIAVIALIGLGILR